MKTDQSPARANSGDHSNLTQESVPESPNKTLGNNTVITVSKPYYIIWYQVSEYSRRVKEEKTHRNFPAGDINYHHNIPYIN